MYSNKELRVAIGNALEKHHKQYSAVFQPSTIVPYYDETTTLLSGFAVYKYNCGTDSMSVSYFDANLNSSDTEPIGRPNIVSDVAPTTPAPTASPTPAPDGSTPAPTAAPSTTTAPTAAPTLAPTGAPTTSPTGAPTTAPTLAPTNAPS